MLSGVSLVMCLGFLSPGATATRPTRTDDMEGVRHTSVIQQHQQLQSLTQQVLAKEAALATNATAQAAYRKERPAALSLGDGDEHNDGDPMSKPGAVGVKEHGDNNAMSKPGTMMTYEPGDFAEYRLPEGPHEGHWVACTIVGPGGDPNTLTIHVWTNGESDVAGHLSGKDVPNVPPEHLRVTRKMEHEDEQVILAGVAHEILDNISSAKSLKEPTPEQDKIVKDEAREIMTSVKGDVDDKFPSEKAAEPDKAAKGSASPVASPRARLIVLCLPAAASILI